MATGGAVPFCSECHALLDLPDEDPIICRVCHFATSFTGMYVFRRLSSALSLSFFRLFYPAFSKVIRHN